jgi:hypothetical protein
MAAPAPVPPLTILSNSPIVKSSKP